MTHLTYQDALDLKECGFPQDDALFYWSKHTKPETWWAVGNLPSTVSDNKLTACPDLGELVRECMGEGGFRKLVWLDMNDEELALQKNILNVDGSWMAESYSHQKYGSTPEQAVKALYCALNKKPDNV